MTGVEGNGYQGARERILDAAYPLFSRHGIHAVGIDRIVSDAEVAKMTLYRHFPSKEELVLAFLDLREQRWTTGWLQREVELRASDPAMRMLTLFDVLDEWFRRHDYEGCAFVNTLLETHGEGGPIYESAATHLATIRELIAGWAVRAGAADAETTAYQLQTLMMGAIVSAARGDRDAAGRSRELARMIVERLPA